MRRVAVMLVTTAAFLTVHAIIQARLMVTRKILWKPWTWVRPASAGCGSGPGTSCRLVPAYLSYFRPSFHPNDRDTQRLVDDWQDRMFGEARAA